MNKVLTPARGAIIAATFVGLALPAVAQGQLSQTIQNGERATRSAETVQQQINQLDDERTDMVGEFRTLLQRKDAALLYASQQEAAVASQRAELASLEDQLGRVDEITSQTAPMLVELVDDLEAFINVDLPFRIEKRRENIQKLRDNLTDPDVSVPAAYRAIMDEYQREMEFGRTTDTWKENVDIDGKTVSVDMVLFGRVALVYMDENQRYAKRYDRPTKAWVDLEPKYKAEVQKAIRIIQKKRTKDMMYVPATKMAVSAN